VGSPAFYLHQHGLLNDVCEFLLLLFALVHFLFQVSYLLAKDVKAMAICGTIRDGTDEGCVGIFKRLTSDK